MQTITSRANAKIKYACSLKKADVRNSEQRLLTEGLRLCADAAENAVEIESCFLTEKLLKEKACEPILRASKEVFLIEPSVAEKLADTKNPQGIFCICKKPAFCQTADVNGKYLLLENMADPGNLGTAIRTAEAFGLSGIILSGCCDAFSPKAMRAAMGATFRFALLEDNDGRILHEAICKGMELYCSVVTPTAEDVKCIRGKTGVIVAVGNEANGLSQALLSCGKAITIPMAGRAESFNASQAATVIMYEMAQ